jgi:IS30 family transposase
LHVTSDRGSEFVSHFWRSLGRALEMKLHFTLGYHPEGDGQTEHANQTLEQYLQIYCNYQQSNWASLLPITEFAYNNAPVPLLVYLLSSPTRATTRTSKSILSMN